MPTFSDSSRHRLYTCHHDLVRVCEAAIQRTDFAVLCGHRTRAEQDEAFRTGHSQVQWPDSKHNSTPSTAIDLAPFPIDWDDLDRFRVLGGYILATGHCLGVDLRWGGDWDGDFNLRDQRFIDLPHFELLR